MLLLKVSGNYGKSLQVMKSHWVLKKSMGAKSVVGI
jgi:hypothetical protein